MGRSLALLLAWVVLAWLALPACGRASTARAPEPAPAEPARGPRVAFAISPRVEGVDVYPGRPPKELDVALLRPEVRRVTWSDGKPVDRAEHVLLVFSKVPLARFSRDVAPHVLRELTLPSGVAVVFRPAFFDAAVEPVTVQAAPLATFDDVATAELGEAKATSVSIANGRLTKREAAHAGVTLTLRAEARARIAELASSHEGHSLVLALDHWFAGEARASAGIEELYLAFSWLDGDGEDERAARDFVAAVRARRPSRP